MFGMGDNCVILKGTPPDYRKKESFQEKLKYYCSKHHWDKAKLFGAALDEDSDGYLKPTVGLFLYNTWCNFKSWYPIWQTRQFLQRLFRPSHISNSDIWETGYWISNQAYKIISAFRKSERNGYPGEFDNEKEWDEVLDHILMALEFHKVDGDSKLESQWYQKYFGMDPFEKNEVNEHTSYYYREINSRKNIGSCSSSKMPNLDDVEWCVKETSYINFSLINYAAECVQIGYELMGQYMLAMWD